MWPSKEWQKTTCVDDVLKEKHLANPHLNLQLHKKKASQPIRDIPDPEDVLDPLVMDVVDVVVVKVAFEEEVAEEEVLTMVWEIGIQTEEDLLVLVDGEIIPQVLVKEKDIPNLLDDSRQDHYQE